MALFTTTLDLYGGVLWSGELQGFIIHQMMPIIAGDMQAMTDVSEMAQELMSACERAMAVINCADTGSGAHDTATTAFEESGASQLGELGYEYENLSWESMVLIPGSHQPLFSGYLGQQISDPWIKIKW
jgi:hypothetical protein